jgi:hypothetical protein
LFIACRVNQMVIPDRDVLRKVVEALIDARFDADNPGQYAAKILAVVRQSDLEMVGSAIQYLLNASVEAVQEFHGEPPPERGSLVIMRFHLAEMRAKADSGDLPLPSTQINDLSRLFSERDPFSSDLNSRMSVDGSGVKRVSQEQMRHSASVRRSGASTTEFPRAPSMSGTSRKEPVPEQLVDVDILGRPVKRNEAPYYAFAAITLGLAVGLSLEVLESPWPLWVKVVISAVVPLVVLSAVAVSKSLRFLRYLRIILVWGSIAALILAAGSFCYKTYRTFITLKRHDRVERTFDVLSGAIGRYHAKEGIYPRSLDALFSPTDYLKDSSIRGSSDFLDPFAKRGKSYSYSRSLEGYMLHSVGPRGAALEFDIPSRITADFQRDLVAASYDPTNGLMSGGGLFLLGRPRGN